ncbi:DNA-directed RNA polymerase subunit D [Candidatus Woesearchaeota archaeon]|nr:DNA-directed RNA polymerase subunit D [Candidatus Woesearchaeota archaeon]
MEIQLLSSDKKKNKMSFILKGADPAFANAIRRCAIEEVQTMAIDDVEFRKNSSAFYDEMIAHRLGLVTLTTDLKTYNLPENCKCNGEGCARCSLKMTLKSSGPWQVYASELKSKDPKVKPVFGDTPIVKLLKGQKLELEVTAVLGKGKSHMKWSPGLVYYKYMPEVKIGEVKNAEEIAKACPPGVFEVKEGKLFVNKDELLKHDLAGMAEKVSGGAVTIEENPEEFVFCVESWGQLDCKEIIEQAAQEFESQLEEFGKLIKEK